MGEEEAEERERCDRQPPQAGLEGEGHPLPEEGRGRQEGGRQGLWFDIREEGLATRHHPTEEEGAGSLLRA